MIFPASRTATMALIAAMALASCSSEADPETAPEAGEAGSAASGQEMLPVEPGGGIGDGAPAHSGASTTEIIPPALYGRWGLVPADCTSTRGDAKGLLTVAPTTLTFYESMARLQNIENADTGSIRAGFDFEGEGMVWERKIELESRAGGARLVKREYGENAPGPLEYSRCAANPNN
ncbi:hypothetical protein [Pseudopontixanthobacter vadosimaris]|uniref:hypothetical protein n=1 Tax=Pseudopontixanthobacter vadosimaris TaxID=2726450 RepID=UPI0014764454|nr:hypothetical protein [Pseudopontixanthobacter vadosimaris]